MRGPSAIERSQKKLYLAIKAELAPYEKQKSKELISYEKAFRASLPQRARAGTKEELLRALLKSKAIFVGDFHPFRQSQKGYLRILNECVPKLPRVTIALECIQQAHQSAVNEYLLGLITVEELRDKIDFEKYWPFSWENYREILLFAKKNKISVLALNILNRKRKSGFLRERDSAAAERICRELIDHPNTSVFVLYGELHLGRKHLPHDLKKLLPEGTRISVVHQNNTDLYWKAPALKSGQRAEVLRLSSHEFCILNSVPWVKLRSYLDWLEGGSAASDWDEQLDISGIVHHYARLLSEAVGFKSTIRDDLDFYEPERIGSSNAKQLFKKLKQDKILATHSLYYHRTSYLAGAGALLMPAIGTNSLSEAASYLLLHTQKTRQVIPHKVSIQSATALFLIGYLGSKILNPKRKCNEVEDLKSWSRKASLSAPAAALKILRPYLQKGKHQQPPDKKVTSKRDLEACRLAGYVLGERLFLCLLVDPTLLSLVRAWYQCGSPEASRVLLAETAAVIRRTTITSSSKLEKF